MASSLRVKFGTNILALGSNCLKRNDALAVPAVTYQQQREKKKRAGGSVKNKRTTTKPKPFGAIRGNGQFVYQGETLVLQRRLVFYPGENVGIQKNCMLYALRDGKVVVTCEKLNPYPDSPLHKAVNDYGHTIYKKFINVYPIPVHAKFKLVTEPLT